MAAALSAAAFSLIAIVSANAEDVPVDLELVLAVDVSASVDMDEQRLQRLGYVAAFRSQAVIDAITSGPLGRIAVAYVEWGDPTGRRVVVPWTLVDGRARAEALAEALEAAPMNRFFGTSIAGALSFSGHLLSRNAFVGERMTVDISGDGPNNMGAPVVPARDAVVASGITINGLPVMLRVGWSGGLRAVALDRYYHDCVIGGPGAFMVVVKRRAEFANAIVRKLLLEILSGEPARIVPIASVEPQSRMDCLVGEKSSGRLPSVD